MPTPFDPARQQASTVCLPPGHWATVLDCLCDHFKAIDRAQWLDRFVYYFRRQHYEIEKVINIRCDYII